MYTVVLILASLLPFQYATVTDTQNKSGNSNVAPSAQPNVAPQVAPSVPQPSVPAAAPSAQRHPKPQPVHSSVKVRPAPPGKGPKAVVPVPDPAHPPVTLLVTEYQLRLVWTNVGWVYVRVPVNYYVIAVWNPAYQAYGYYDRAGIYHLYVPPVVVLPAASQPATPKK